jgi:hypothetical protein
MQKTVHSAQCSVVRRVLSCVLCTVFCALSACVPVEQLPPGLVPMNPTAAAATTFPDLEGGGMTTTSTHFTIKAYSQTDLDALKTMAESDINKIGNDTGLYSFVASQSFTLVAYRDRDEFLKKTHQPSWSHVVASGKGIYFYYPDPDMEPILVHFLVHEILSGYMGDKVTSYKWLDEGLAMSEEVAKMSDADRIAYSNSKNSQLRLNRMAFSQMTFFVTNTEEKRRTDAWYQQVESVMTFLLAQGSPLAFAQFLSELRTVEIDQALSDAYSAKFRSLSDLETAWKYTI